MGLLNGSFPSLINGVSQQPDNQRLPTQGAEQINGVSSLMDGLYKRPPTEHIARVNSSNYAYPYVHYIDRDKTEKYIVLATKGGIQVAGADGTLYPVYGSDADMAYLQCDSPNIDLKFLTVADTTFVLNRTKITALTTDVTAVPPYQALIWVREGSYKCNYKINITGYAQPDYETTEANPSTIQTIWIATQLYTQLVTFLGPTWTALQEENAIWLKKVDNTPFVINVSDDNGNHNMSLITDQVQHFTDLPEVAVNGYTTRVLGNIESDSDDYWVAFSTYGNKAFGKGLWREYIAPGSRFKFDLTTLPHILTRKQDVDGTITGTVGSIYFNFSTAPFDDRLAGDEKSCPAPSFIGNTLSDVFLHRGRLGFLSKGFLCMSQAGELFNFWRQTATSLLDSDPIDVAVAHERAVNLRHAISYEADLVVFADHTQFTVKGGDILSPKTVSVQVATEYSSHLDTPPVHAESSLYFPFDNGSFSGMREYFIVNQSLQKEAASITEHCSRYIQGSITKIAVANSSNMLVCLSDVNRSKTWVYSWYYNGGQKVQSSWGQWNFGNNTVVVGAGFLGEHLYIVCVYPDGTYIEKIRLDPGNQDEFNPGYLTLLDRRVNEKSPGVVITYDDIKNQTTIRPPYLMDPADEWVVVSRAASDVTWVPGRALTQVSRDTLSIVVNGDARKGCWLGRKYTFLFTFGKPQLRSQTPTGGLDNVTEGRLQIKDFSVKYSRSGYFRVEVTPQSRDTVVYPMTGNILRAPLPTNLGSPQLRTGVLRFPVMSRNDQATISVINDTHLPSYVNGAEWVGNFWSRAKRI